MDKMFEKMIKGKNAEESHNKVRVYLWILLFMNKTFTFVLTVAIFGTLTGDIRGIIVALSMVFLIAFGRKVIIGLKEVRNETAKLMCVETGKSIEEITAEDKEWEKYLYLFIASCKNDKEAIKRTFLKK